MVTATTISAFAASGVAPFDLYTLRHTCLTRWAPHMDAFTLGYMQRVSGHKSGHTAEIANMGVTAGTALIN